MANAFVLVYAGGRERDIIADIRNLPFIEEAYVAVLYPSEEAIIAKLVAPNMTRKQVQEFVRENIRSMDAVNSTSIQDVVRPEEKQQEIDESLIEEERGNWGPWR